MAYSAQKSAIPPPSPSPYSRLPTPANSHFNRPQNSRSVSSSAYGSLHPSPSRPTLQPHHNPYDSFAPQPCPTPTPTSTSKSPGFGLHRSASTVHSSHKRQTSIAEKAKMFERLDDGMMRSPGVSAGPGYGSGAGNLKIPSSHGTKRDPLGSITSPTSHRMPSRPSSYVESGNHQEFFGDVKNQISGLRRPSQPLNILPNGLGDRQAQEYDSQASLVTQPSPSPMRKSLGLLSEPSPVPLQPKESIRMDDSQLMPPPPSLIRQLSASSHQTPVTVEAPIQAPLKPPTPTPPSQVPTPSPRKGSHIRAQSHVIGPTSKLPPRSTSTRPMDPRPTSTVGKKVMGPPRPPSTLHSIPSARPRAVSHNAAEARRIATPANDLPLPKGTRHASGRIIAPPRPTSTRPNEPVPSSTGARRPTVSGNRPRPPSSHIAAPPSGYSSKGSDTESSMRSESVASTNSNTSSVRSDLTTRPKTANRPTTAYKTAQEPQSPVRSHKKTTSIMAAAKPSKPSFNTFKVEYQPAVLAPKPSMASLLHQQPQTATSSVQSTEVFHAQTRLLQLAILHAKSFNSTTALKTSAHDKLYKRFSSIRNKSLSVADSHRREQELVDLHSLSLVLKKSAMLNTGSGHPKDKLSNSPEEAIQVLSEHLSKVLGWFAEGQYEGEYTRMTRIFEEWLSLPDEHEKKIDGLGVEYAKDVLRVKRKMEMALRGLEGWIVLVVDGEKSEEGEEPLGLKSSLGRILSVAVGRLKVGLEELSAIQTVEKTVVTTLRKELKKKVGDLVEARKEVDLVQQRKDLAAWTPAWS
ncbi:hypothetical protein TWF679_005373 [Orbilia oligospora]|uniref:Uncharacterized protein n=1 Tax=Orbilia oligospora TaxID=2813651 RepID=A0A8H8VBX5_ORBOL|nr:hypothetical protein TWF679_005373 [Orbilia oligospora]